MLALLASPAAASAHLRSGTVAVDYEVGVSHPATAAYSANIYQSDHGLTLSLKPGHVVVLLGYLGEPVFRLDRAGLWVNAASPSAVATNLLPKARAVAAATPRWRLQRGRHAATWHDARTQGLPQGLERGTWSVPLIVDGHRTRLTGELRRFPAPALWLWLGVLACCLAAVSAPLLARRRDLRRAWAKRLALGAAGASAVLLFAFALDAYASPGTWIEALDAAAFLAVGVWMMVRSPHNLHLVGAVAVGLVALAVGLLDGPVFLHPIVLAVLPGTAVRLLVVAAVSVGFTAAALGALLYEEIAAAMGSQEPAAVAGSRGTLRVDLHRSPGDGATASYRPDGVR